MMRAAALWGLGLLVALLLSLPAVAAAAEVLQVRSGNLLQVGDHNRTYSVELACLSLPADGDAAAAAWLREQLPRRTRVNLRPVSNHEGTLLARVQRLGGGADGTDLSQGLIDAGLASALPECQA